MIPKKNIYLNNFSSFLPEKIISNEDIVNAMSPGASAEVIQRAVGSKRKRVLSDRLMGSDMLAAVGKEILRSSMSSASDVDRLICSCDPLDQAAPDPAAITQYKLGLSCHSYTISMSCVGWLCGVYNAVAYITAALSKNIMVLSSSTVGSRYFFNGPMYRAIFGDGAGGAFVQEHPSEMGAQILSIDLITIGNFYKEIFAPLSWTVVPPEIPESFKASFYMNKDNRVFFSALDEFIKPFFHKQFIESGISKDDIALFVVHQASMPIFNHTISSFGIPKDKTLDFYSEYGNTISAELPMYADLAIKSGRIKKGDLVCFLTYGAGFTAGSMIVKF